MNEAHDLSPADLSRALPGLAQLTEKVAQVHGADEPSLLELRSVFALTSRALDYLGQGGADRGAAFEATLGLDRLHALTHGYLPPAAACRSYRAMLDGLAHLDSDARPILQALLKTGPAAH